MSTRPLQAPKEPLSIADEGRLGYPASEGGKRCDAIARILRLELDDPELTLAFATSAPPGAPVLQARHRRAAELYLRAWPVPLDFNASEGLRGRPVGWTVTLPAGESGAEVIIELKAPLTTGRYRVEATLEPRFGDRPPEFSVLVTDLLLAVTSDDTELLVRALSASTGGPVAGTRVRLLSPAPRGVRSRQVGAATTGPDGLVRFSRPDLRAGLALSVSAMHGGDASTVYLQSQPAAEPTPVTPTFGALGIDRNAAAPGERVRWRAVVLRDTGNGPPRPLDGAELTVTLRQPWGAVVASWKATAGPFGTASGEIELPAGPPPSEGWQVTLHASPEAGATAGAALATTRVLAVRPSPAIRAALDPLTAGDRPETVRLAGTVLGADSRPLAGAAVSWQVRGSDTSRFAPLPPRVSPNRSATSSIVAAGETVAGADGRFAAVFSPGPWKSRTIAVVATVTDSYGNTAAGQRNVGLWGGTVRLDIGGTTVLRQGETAVLRFQRRLVDGLDGVPGESVVRLLRLPWVEEERQPTYHRVVDEGSLHNPERLVERPEWLLQTLPAGEEVARATARHDLTGEARLAFPGLAPGVYRVVAESRSGAEVTRATRHLVVDGPGARLPLPLAMLADLGDAGPTRVWVSSSAATGPVVLELHRRDHPVETRLLNSPASLLLEARDDAPVTVRALAVHRGTLLALESTLAAAQQPLRVELEQASPDVVCRVVDAAGAAVEGAEVAVAAVDGQSWLWGGDPRRWPLWSNAPLVTSDRDLKWSVAPLVTGNRGFAYRQKVYPPLAPGVAYGPARRSIQGAALCSHARA